MKTGLFLLFAMTLPAMADDAILSVGCDDPAMANTRPCAADRARAAMPDRPADAPLWLACGGSCLVLDEGDGSRIVPMVEDGTMDQPGVFLEKQHLLHGYAPTVCLSERLAFLDDDGMVRVYQMTRAVPGNAKMIQPKNSEGDDLRLSPGEGRLSCDGQRLATQDPLGLGMLVTDVESGMMLRPEMPDTDWLMMSPNGRFGLAVQPNGYTIHDFARKSADINIPARFELDLPMFDVDESHLLLVHSADVVPTTDIFRLSDGALIGMVPERVALAYPTDVTETAAGVAISVLPRNVNEVVD